jgi:hypothetical protein
MIVIGDPSHIIKAGGAAKNKKEGFPGRAGGRPGRLGKYYEKIPSRGKF